MQRKIVTEHGEGTRRTARRRRHEKGLRNVRPSAIAQWKQPCERNRLYYTTLIALTPRVKMADSNSRKRKADSGVRPDVDDDVDADGPLADGNAGLTGDGTRDLGEMNYGDSGDDEENEQEYDDDNQMEEQEEDDDDEDEEEMGSSEGEEVGSSSNVEQNPSRKRAAGISKEVFIPGRDAIAEGETLQMDPSAYVMYHAWTADASCLSFDVMPDRQGPARTKFPLTATIVAGTQAESSNANKLLVMRLSNLCKTQEGADDDDDDSIDDEDNEDPVVEAQRIPHPGAVNRVRVMPQEPHVVATWSETGRVLLWDTRPQVRVLEALAAGGGAATAGAGAASTLRPVCNFAGHTQEGWALDWSTVQPGRLATGGCDGRIHILDPDQAKAQAAVRAAPGEGDLQAVWSTDVTPYKGQKGSIEDLQWSPNEGTVFASCGTDGTVRIWDSRVKDKSMLHVAGAEAGVDVNVLSWSRRVAFLLASGDDKGGFKVWDLRSFKRYVRARTSVHGRLATLAHVHIASHTPAAMHACLLYRTDRSTPLHTLLQRIAHRLLHVAQWPPVRSGVGPPGRELPRSRQWRWYCHSVGHEPGGR